MGAKRIAAAALLYVGALAPAALAGVMDKAIYMNTYYCAGAAAMYGERLGASGSFSHRGEASEAAQAAVELRSRAQSFGRRLGYSDAEGQRAEAQGRRTMAGLLPENGAWRSGGPIPQDAFRQYKHCASLAGM